MPYQKEETGFRGLYLLKSSVYKDERGFFTETYSKKDLEEVGINHDFRQDNLSGSCRNSLRGMHFQVPPFAQAKLIRVIKGSALDVVVDLRVKEPTYGKAYEVELSDHNLLMLYIPEGFAHGFLSLKDDTLFSYKCSNYYDASSEMGLSWNDPAFNINWGIIDPILSAKDRHYDSFLNFKSPF